MGPKQVQGPTILGLPLGTPWIILLQALAAVHHGNHLEDAFGNWDQMEHE